MSQQPLDSLVDEFLLTRDYSSKQAANYTSILNMLCRYLDGIEVARRRNGEIDWASIALTDLRPWLDERKAAVGDQTYKKNWQALKLFFDFLANGPDDEDAPGIEMIDRSPMRAMKAPKITKAAEKRIASPDDFAHLVEHTSNAIYEDVRNRSVVAVMFYAGLRSVETVALDLGDVRLKGTEAHPYPHLYVRTSKTGEARHVVILPELRRHLSRWLRERIGIEVDDGPLFTGNAACRDPHGRLSYDGISSWIDRYRARFDYDLPPCHAWRRGATVNLLAAGQDEGDIKIMLGWQPKSPMVDEYAAQARAGLASQRIMSRNAVANGDRDDRSDERAQRRQSRRSNGKQKLHAV